MKIKVFAFLLFALSIFNNTSLCQNFTTNRNAVGLEHNMLFNASIRYTVVQTGTAILNLKEMFNGKMLPSYTSKAPSIGDPTVIEISGLPGAHTQIGAWVGWSTRYWPAKRFKIEGFDEYYGNGWTILADYQNQDYTGCDFIVKCKSGAYTKLRFTFYEATGTNGRLGVSELYFIHPEGTTPYYGLFEQSGNTWIKNESKIFYNLGNVGIGTNNPGSYKLAVKGTIGCGEVIVEDVESWADFVFEPEYNLMPLGELETFVKTNKHLPEIPSAAEVQENGVSVGEMNAKLLQKIEELTLYILEQQEIINKQQESIKSILERVEQLENN